MGVHGSKPVSSRGSAAAERASQSDSERDSNGRRSLSSVSGPEAQVSPAFSALIPSSTVSTSPSPSPRPYNNSLSWSHNSTAPQPSVGGSGYGGSSGNIAKHRRTSSNGSSRGSVRDTGRFVRSDSDAEDILSSTDSVHNNISSTKVRSPSTGLPQSVSASSLPSNGGISGSIVHRIRSSSVSRRTSSTSGLSMFTSTIPPPPTSAAPIIAVAVPVPSPSTAAVASKGRVEIDEAHHRTSSPGPLRPPHARSGSGSLTFFRRSSAIPIAGNVGAGGSERGSLTGINNLTTTSTAPTRPRSNTNAVAPPSPSSSGSIGSSSRGSCNTSVGVGSSSSSSSSDDSSTLGSSSEGSSSFSGNVSSSLPRSTSSIPGAALTGRNSISRLRSNSESSITPTAQATTRSGFGSSIRRLSRGSPPARSSSNPPTTVVHERSASSSNIPPPPPPRPSLRPREASPAHARDMSKSPPRRGSQMVSSFSNRFRFRSRSRSRSRGVSPSLAYHNKEYNSNNRMQLPNEVVFHICGFVGLRGLGRLASTSRMLAQEDLLWRAMALLTYGAHCQLNLYVGSWRALCIDDNRKNEPFAPPPLSENQVAVLAFGGEDPPAPRYLHESEPLLDVLFDSNWEMVRVMCSVQEEGNVSRKVSKVLAGALALLAESRGAGCAMCCMLVTLRLTTVAQPEALESIAHAFQASTLSVDVIVAFLRIRCARFVHSVLGRLTNEIMSVDLELDPQRTKTPGDEAGNLTLLINSVSNILRTVTERIDEVPHDVRLLLAHVQAEVGRVSEGRLSETAGLFGGQIFFLRCIVPALITPVRFGLCSQPPAAWQVRNLVLVAKVIQTISTGTLFSTKEPFMIPCNEFIKSTMPNVRTFCDALLSPRYTPDSERRLIFSESHLATAQHRLLRVITDSPFRRPLEVALRALYPQLPNLLDGNRWGFAKLLSGLSTSSD